MKNYRYHTGVKVSPDGQRQLVVGTAPRQWLDGKMWKPIETDLQTSANSFDLTKSAFEVQIPKRANDTILFGNVGSEFRMKPVCSAVDGVLEEQNKVIYSNAFGSGIDMQVIVNRKGIRKWVVINKTRQKQLSFDFEIATTGLPEIQTKKTFSQLSLAKDSDSDVVTTLRNVEAWDSKRRPVKVNSTIVKELGKLILRKTVTIPDKPNFPIITDADVTVTSHSCDGQIVYTSPVSWAAARSNATGTVSAAGNDMYSYVDSFMGMMFTIGRVGITFLTSGVGASGTVTSSTLKLSIKYAGAANHPCDLVSFAPNSETSYVTGDYAIAKWGSTVYTTTDIKTASASFTDETFTLNATGLSAIDKTGYTVFGIREQVHDIDDTSPSAYRGNIIETSETANDPELTVNYRIGSRPKINSSLAENRLVKGGVIS